MTCPNSIMWKEWGETESQHEDITYWQPEKALLEYKI